MLRVKKGAPSVSANSTMLRSAPEYHPPLPTITTGLFERESIRKNSETLRSGGSQSVSGTGALAGEVSFSSQPG